MTTTLPIVVGVDGSDISKAAIAWAARAAARYDCPLHLVTAQAATAAYGGLMMASQEFYDDLEQATKEVLVEARAVAADAAPGITAATMIVHGSPIPAMLDQSESARMLVLGTRGLGALRGALLGSVTSALVAHAQCPVVVVPPGDAPAADGPIVVGVDGTANSEPAIEAAFVEASLRAVPLVAVHAWSDVDFDTLPAAVENLPWESLETSEEATLAESLAGWQDRFPDVEVRRVVARDRPVDQLIEQSGAAQLVVVGSHGRGGFRGMLLGSTSRDLLHRSELPLMIVRDRRQA